MANATVTAAAGRPGGGRKVLWCIACGKPVYHAAEAARVKCLYACFACVMDEPTLVADVRNWIQKWV